MRLGLGVDRADLGIRRRGKPLATAKGLRADTEGTSQEIDEVLRLGSVNHNFLIPKTVMRIASISLGCCKDSMM